MISKTSSLRHKRAGFTLIEVSLAVLVLGLGLMVAFGLFPAGVRQNEESTADTRAALFADYVLNGMQANAATVTNWSEWDAEKGVGYLRILGKDGHPACLNADSAGKPGLTGVQNVSPVNGEPVEWPASTGQDPKPMLRYRLTMSADSGNHVYTAMLEVKDLNDGSDFDPPDGVFYTAFVFKGM